MLKTLGKTEDGNHEGVNTVGYSVKAVDMEEVSCTGVTAWEAVVFCSVFP